MKGPKDLEPPITDEEQPIVRHHIAEIEKYFARPVAGNYPPSINLYEYCAAVHDAIVAEVREAGGLVDIEGSSTIVIRRPKT